MTDKQVIFQGTDGLVVPVKAVDNGDGTFALDVEATLTTGPITIGDVGVKGSVSAVVADVDTVTKALLVKAAVPVLVDSNSPLVVDGSGVTQPVSAAALPLPAGASEEATQVLNLVALTGLNTVEGQATDAGVTGDNPGSISAKLRGLATIADATFDGTDRVQVTAVIEAAQEIKVNNFPGVQQVAFGNDAYSDAFGRLRVSNPTSIFDSSFQYDLSPLLWVSKLTSLGTVTHLPNVASTRLTVPVTNGAAAVYQTRHYHRYQPGKSQRIEMTQVFGAAVANVDRRAGYFDAANGIFLEQHGTTDLAFVRRTSASGSLVDNRVVKASWNIDPFDGSGPSGIILDITKAMILMIDLQWLAMGRVRVGFNIDGQVYYAHEFLTANVLSTVYMSTANLPVRWEIANTALSAGATFDVTCVSVVSEGGFEIDKGYDMGAASAADISVNATLLPIIAIRPIATFNGLVNRGLIQAVDFSGLAGANPTLFQVVYGGVLTAGAWSAPNASSIAEVNTTATVITGGIVIASFYVNGGGANRQSASRDFVTHYPLTLDVDGANPLNLALCAISVGGATNTRGAINWREVR